MKILKKCLGILGVVAAGIIALLAIMLIPGISSIEQYKVNHGESDW